jgi:sarcosine oxidase
MDDREAFDVIVVGLGAMGSAACVHLARRGVRVLGLEQFSIPNSLGSSHGDSRMIRLCYYEHPDYVPLLHRAYELWDELEAASARRILFRTGGLYMGEPESGFISGTLRAARDHQLAHEEFSRERIKTKYPQFKIPPDHIGVYEPHAGFLLPEVAISAHAELALRLGAHLRGHEPMLEWFSDSSGVTVRTAKGLHHAQQIIFCGGAWSSRVLGDIGVKLQPTRQPLAWVWPRTPELFELGRIPVWAINNPNDTQYYGFPMIHTRPGFKLARHFHGQPTDPDSISRVPTADDEADIRQALRTFIPEADGQLLSMAICMYTNSPDSHFIVDRHPTCERALIACGFSGHGFKFASVIGEALADLSVRGRSDLPIGFLGLKRFALDTPGNAGSPSSS